MDALFLSQEQKKLMDLLSDSESLQLRASNSVISIVPNNDEDTEKWLNLPINDNKIAWGMTKSNIETLVGFQLPDTPQEMIDLIHSNQSQQQASTLSESLNLKSDWELVLSGGGAIITDKFVERVTKTAEEKKLKINFTMHHHPNLGLSVWALESKSLSERQAYYKKLLQFSSADLRSMVDADIEFFEIRALGTAKDIASKVETTSRIYKTKEISKESKHLGELINQAKLPQDENDTPEKLGELALQIEFEISQLATKDYPIKSLIEYYVGKEEYKKGLNDFRDRKIPVSNKALVIYHLLNTDDKPFPKLTTELFKTRQETDITALISKAGEMYEQGGESKKKIDDAISKDGLHDMFWITTSTDSARIKVMADKVRQLLV